MMKYCWNGLYGNPSSLHSSPELAYSSQTNIILSRLIRKKIQFCQQKYVFFNRALCLPYRFGVFVWENKQRLRFLVSFNWIASNISRQKRHQSINNYFSIYPLFWERINKNYHCIQISFYRKFRKIRWIFGKSIIIPLNETFHSWLTRISDHL